MSTTTVYNMQWLSKKNKTKAKAKAKKRKTVKKEKPIVYPVFEQCAYITDDPYWKTIFNQCARGRFPRYFYYKNGLITWRKGNKIDRVLISESKTSEDAYDVYNISTDFFRLKAGMYSDIDRQRMKEEEEKRISERVLKDFTWANIKKSKIKELLITEYVEMLSNDYSLSQQEKIELITTIKTGFTLKWLKDVEMEEGRIVAISGLDWNENTECFEIDPSKKKRVKKKKYPGLGIEIQNTAPKVDFIKDWEKYIESLEKERKIKQNLSSTKSKSHSSVYKSLTKSSSTISITVSNTSSYSS